MPIAYLPSMIPPPAPSALHPQLRGDKLGSGAAAVVCGGDPTTAAATPPSERKRSLSDVYAHGAPRVRPPVKQRRKHRVNSPMRSVGSGASSSGFHGGGDRSGGEEANCPRMHSQR